MDNERSEQSAAKARFLAAIREYVDVKAAAAGYLYYAGRLGL